MRARLGLRYAGIRCELREVVLKDKPPEMVALSPKATVPVLHLPEGQVIDQSYDIIKWALGQNDPDGWQKFIDKADVLVDENDGTFKTALDKYKYASRFPDSSAETYRDQGEIFLKKLDQMLKASPFLSGAQQTVSDIAVFPFIRQFAHVDKTWFFDTPYPHLHQWLNRLLDSEMFAAVMVKYPKWHGGDETQYFPSASA